jgi:hypothetical protein
MKLTLDYEERIIELHKNVEIVDLIAQLVIYGINLEGWKIKLPEEKIVYQDYPVIPPYYVPTIPHYYGSDVTTYCNGGVGTTTSITTNKNSFTCTEGYNKLGLVTALYGTLTNL